MDKQQKRNAMGQLTDEELYNLINRKILIKQ